MCEGPCHILAHMDIRVSHDLLMRILWMHMPTMPNDQSRDNAIVDLVITTEHKHVTYRCKRIIAKRRAEQMLLRFLNV